MMPVELRIRRTWRWFALLYLAILVALAVVDRTPLAIGVASLFALMIPILVTVRLRVVDGVFRYAPPLDVFKRSRVDLNRLAEVRLGPKIRLVGAFLFLRDQDNHKLWITSDMEGWQGLAREVAEKSLQRDVLITESSRRRLEACLGSNQDG